MNDRLARSYGRRSFLKSSALVGLAAAVPRSLWAQNGGGGESLRVLFVGTGARGEANVTQTMNHARTVAAGFVDVNTQNMTKWQERYPDAFFLQDYRQAFADHADAFDAVVISTPDHMHAPILLTAMAADKHVYCEKPLVHQLDEIRMVRNAVAAKPNLVTQMGNQRACNRGRVEVVEGIRAGVFGKVKEAWAWTGTMSADRFFRDPWREEFLDAQEVPEHIDWNLWRGCYEHDLDFHIDYAEKKWRSFWPFGLGLFGDWSPHNIDAVFYALELGHGPRSVVTQAPQDATRATVGTNMSSTMVYAGNERTMEDTIRIHNSDGGITPDLVELGLPERVRMGRHMSLIDTEAGAILLSPDGRWQLYRDGARVSLSEMDDLEIGSYHHWHDWVDNCLGGDKRLWSPLDVAADITEACILPVKASKFRGQTLEWNSETCRFAGGDEFNEVTMRAYRDGFGVPAQFA